MNSKVPSNKTVVNTRISLYLLIMLSQNKQLPCDLVLLVAPAAQGSAALSGTPTPLHWSPQNRLRGYFAVYTEVCRDPGLVALSWSPQIRSVGALLPQCAAPIACWRGSCSGSARKSPHSKLGLPSTSGCTHVFKVEGCSHLLRNALDSVLFVIKLWEAVDQI